MPNRIPGKAAVFDGSAFYQAIEATRQGRKLTWRQVAVQAGVSASTLTRMSQGKHPDVDSLAALAAWAGLEPKRFMSMAVPVQSHAEPLAMISTYLRSDPNLSREAAEALDAVIRAAYARLRKG